MPKHHIMLNGVPLGQTTRDSWLQDFTYDIRSLMVAKFIAGQKEHKGDIGAVSTPDIVGHLIEEAMDQLFYAGELKRRLISADGFVVVSRSSLAAVVRSIMECETRKVLRPDPELLAALTEIDNTLKNV